MVNFERERKKVPFLVLDGAMGTELAARGFDTDDALWSAKALFEQPALIRAIHAAYYAAGADISTSASYQATVEGFEKKGFGRRTAKELMLRSVKLTREARDAAAKTWCGSPTPYQTFVATWYEAGAALIGGCCRTHPKDIADIAAFRAGLLS